MSAPKHHVTFAGKKPACFNSVEDYAEWKKQARRSCVHPKTSVCTDCLPEFQALMIECGRCENPEIKFKWVPVKVNKWETVQEMQGYLPSAAEQIKSKQGEKHV
jgi:hypothetical protein